MFGVLYKHFSNTDRPECGSKSRTDQSYAAEAWCVSNSALGLLYGHGILTIYENLLL